MSESQIKDVCIRVRSVNNSDYEIQHNLIKDYNRKSIKANNIDELDKELSEYGYRKVFDTIKHDYQWCKDGMSSKIQLQEIKDIGLLLYYDNKEYYEYDLDTQRRKLIDELNSYGFNFDYDVLGIDKLRTLYYKKKMYSKNQNG
jgi:hypothetical protein